MHQSQSIAKLAVKTHMKQQLKKIRNEKFAAGARRDRL
jgi:hypothetical protein